MHVTMAFIIPGVETGWNEKYLNGSTMKDLSDDPSNHEWTLYHKGISRFGWDGEMPVRE